MLKDNFEYNGNFNIKKLNYIDLGPTGADTLEIDIKDNLKFNYENDRIDFSITRTVAFNPPEVYELEVTLNSFLKEKLDSNYGGEVISKKEFIENFEIPISNVCSRISAIISNITVYSGPPLITPPQLIEESK